MIRKPKIDITLPITPKPKGRPRMSRKGHAYTPAETRKWEGQCAAMLAQHAPAEPFDGPLIMDVLFVMPRPGYMCKKDRSGKLKHDPNLQWKCNKADLDNLWKSLKDSISLSKWWRDDCQVTCGVLLKCYAELGGSARIEVMVSEAGDTPESIWMTTRAQRGSLLR